MKTIQNRIYEGIPVGIEVRGSINDEFTFRVRPGNGFYNAIKGEIYQDRYSYFVPGSINNIQSEPYRRQWIAAVRKWQYGVTDADKLAYNRQATKKLRMSGYNLFMRLAMKGAIEMYVDRGDPAAVDFAIGDFTIDGAWHTLDLSGIITLSARAVLLDIDFENNSANKHITLRQNGNSNNINHFDVSTKVAGQDEHTNSIVSPDSARLIEYKIDATGWTALTMSVRGWWT